MYKKNIVILADSFYPNTTMSGNIAGKIADYLSEQNCNVQVIAYKYDKNDSRMINNVKVNYIYNWSYYYEGILLNKLKNNNTILNTIIYKTKKIISNIIRNSNSVGVNKKIVKKIIEKLKELDSQNPIDVILSISAPFEFQIANYMYGNINHKTKNIIYQVDLWITLRDRGLPFFLQSFRKKNREKMLYNMINNTQVIMMPYVKQIEGTDKVISAQLPLIKENKLQVEKNNLNKGVIKIVYAGTLNKIERNPEPFIKFILNSKLNIELDIYQRGDCQSILENYQNMYPQKIKNYGTVSQKVASDAIANADILLMIGTPKGNQIAGKTFEYLSTGKRILYIAQNTEDLNAKFLNNYRGLLVLKTLSESDLIKFEKFAFDDDFKETGFEEILENYYDATPEYFCERYLLNF